MTTSERGKLTPAEAAEAELVLQRYAMYLGRLAQREEASTSLLVDQVTRCVAPRILQQGAYHPDERRALAVLENEVARKLDLELSAAKAKAKRLAYFSMRVEKVATAYGRLAIIKRGNRDGD